MAVDDHAFYERFDSELTELIRLARDPRLTDKMVAGTDAGIDRHLYVLLNLIHDRGPVRARDLLPIVAVDQSTLSRQISSLATNPGRAHGRLADQSSHDTVAIGHAARRRPSHGRRHQRPLSLSGSIGEYSGPVSRLGFLTSLTWSPSGGVTTTRSGEADGGGG
jgi:hypothetical protein